MKQCKNCGGQLVFDILKQDMKCRSCHSEFPIEPEEVSAENTDGNGNSSGDKEAKAADFMEINSFVCPVCGGLITSLSEEIASGFCPYCGNSVRFEGRIDKVKRPRFVIPFQYTKKKCKNAYETFIRKQVFAPDDLKDPEKIDSFRGIYMPYWDYTIHQTGRIDREYVDSHRRGDYIYKDIKRMDWDIDEHRTHILHDASSTFDDKIGLFVTPFEMSGMKKFNSAYLEGFYADTADVPPKDCEDVAYKIVNEQTEDIISSACLGDTRRDHNRDGWTNEIERADICMLPLWFMSYKNGNRVSYSIVNGQTGKMYADVPVDPKKYLLAVGVMTVLLTFITALFLTPTPSWALSITVLVQTVALFAMWHSMNRILVKDGLKAESLKFGRNRSGTGGMSASSRIVVAFIILAVVSSIFLQLVSGLVLAFSNLNGTSVAILCLIPAVFAFIVILTKLGKLKQSNGGHTIFPGYLFTFLCILICDAVLIVNPVHDLWYYVPMAVSIATLLLSVVSMIRLSNMRASRMVPHFATHKGGFDANYEENV